MKQASNENRNHIFRHNASFGKRMEHYVVGRMLKEGLDVFLPIVDDDAIDAVVKKKDGSFIEIQIKARSNNVASGDAALFAAIDHKLRINYYFVFYSERLNKTWILSSEEFVAESNQNKKGKNAGLRSIWFNGKKKGISPGDDIEYAYPKFNKYVDENFSRFK